MSEHFCGTCNRLRITADGNLKVSILPLPPELLITGGGQCPVGGTWGYVGSHRCSSVLHWLFRVAPAVSGVLSSPRCCEDCCPRCHSGLLVTQQGPTSETRTHYLADCHSSGLSLRLWNSMALPEVVDRSLVLICPRHVCAGSEDGGPEDLRNLEEWLRSGLILSESDLRSPYCQEL